MQSRAVYIGLIFTVGLAAQQPQKYAETAVSGNMVTPGKGDPAKAQLRVPEGFKVTKFASGLGNARMIAMGPMGAVYVSRPETNDLVMLRDSNGDGVSDGMKVVASGIDKLHGLFVHQGKLYIAGVKAVYVADLGSDGTPGTPRMIMDRMPDGGQHSKRTLAVGPDGMLYTSIGSTCNDCEDSNPESATMLQSKLDGSGRTVWAKGLRNTIGFDWHPTTKELWGMDNGSDWKGDNVPNEELNRLVKDGNYGWPFCYMDKQVDKANSHDPKGMSKEQFCPTTQGAVLTYPAHSAPIAFTFYNGSQFPGFRGHALAVMRGSWNRKPAQGYKVVHIVFENGQPKRFEDFLTGFLSSDGHEYYGRPAGVALMGDGSVLVSDDNNGVVYRVSHGK